MDTTALPPPDPPEPRETHHMDTTALPPPDPPETCDHCGSNIIQHPNRPTTLWGHNDTPHLYATIHAPLRGPSVLAKPRVTR